MIDKITLNRDIQDRIAELILLFCILGGCIITIVTYTYNRSLWTDEAQLMSSICTRDIRHLVASSLDWNQSASIGYLFIVKLFTELLGTSKNALRLWSLITSFMSLFLVFQLMSRKIRRNYALLFTAILSLTDRYIYFANEAKPYMSDNFFSLLVLFLWQKYRENKISLFKLTLLYSLIIWFSFSTIFFIAACMIIEGYVIMKGLSKGNKIKTFKDILCCALVLISFIFYYVFWLSKTAQNAGGKGYWELLKFPLIPKSFKDIELLQMMYYQFFSFYSKQLSYLICLLVIMYICFVVKNKTDISLILVPFLVSLLLLFIASFLGFYPIQDRLVQIYVIVMLPLCGYMCELIERSFVHTNKDGEWGKYFFYAMLAVMLIAVGKRGYKNLYKEHVYRPGSQVSESVRYLQNNLAENDIIYVSRYSIPVYTYETNYETSFSDLVSIPNNSSKMKSDVLKGLPYKKGNTIFGQMLYKYNYNIPYSYDGYSLEKSIEEDVSLLKECQSVYIFSSHEENGLQDLLDVLERYGTVNTVVDYYNTRLYHYVRNNK